MFLAGLNVPNRLVLELARQVDEPDLQTAALRGAAAKASGR